MSFFHFRSKFPHHSGQLSCHTDACAYDRWSRLGHGRQLHTVTITKGLMSFFHFRSKFPHHSGQLSCHTDACAYDQWSRLGHGRQLHTPSTTQHPFIYFFHINGIFTTTSSPYSLSLPFTLIY